MSRVLGAAFGAVLVGAAGLAGTGDAGPRPWVAVRGIYGGVPQEILDSGRGLREFGVDAVWMGSSAFTAERVALLRAQGVRVFAEFNTLHVADYLKEHPDASPIGPDGKVSPPPDGWQGICPSHEGYRRSRMEAFRRLLREFDVDGVWLDYHHAHASWEQAVPNLPDTCFCARCLRRFEREAGVSLPEVPTAERARLLLSVHRKAWVRWRCDLLTDWVREFREIRDETRPAALLGTFHNPWSDEDHGGARLEKLAIDLRAQAAHLDVFSPMPYHARFGHAADPGWISRQVAWLGRALGVEGKPGERHRIWPIVQISDWGEPVPLGQVPAALDHGSRLPATGVMVFAWGGLRKQPEKVEAVGRVFRSWAGPRSDRAHDRFPPELVEWAPYEGNPLLSGTGGNTWDREIRERGFVLRDVDGWKLWYTGYDTRQGGTKALGLATSPDGIRWARHPGNPVFSGVWTEDVFVVKQDGVYHMFAEGANDIAHRLTSRDGVRWEEQGRLDVRTRSGAPLSPGPYGTPTVWVEGGVFHLFYEREDRGVWLATSRDLRVFTNVQDEPVIALGPGAYDRHAVALNQVVRYRGRYYGVYHANADPDWNGPWTTCLAVSDDLRHWEKYPGNPVIRSDHSSGILVDDGEGLRLYTMHPDVRLWHSRGRASKTRWPDRGSPRSR